MNLIDSIKDGVAKLEDPAEQCNPASKELVASMLGEIDRLKQITRELAYKVEEIACGVITQHGDIVIGEVRYYVGPEKTTKCISKGGTLEALLDAKGGDFEAVCEMLSSDPFKYGAMRAAIGEEPFAKLFKTETKVDLKTGKPLRGLQKADGRFSKLRKG